MTTTRSPFACIARLALVGVFVAACVEDTGELASGTGSSGGNPVQEDPVTVSFQLTSDNTGDTPARASWARASLTAGTVAFGRIDDSGGCTFDPSESWELGAFINFNGDQIASLDRAGLCRIRFQPPAGVPLLVANGETPALRVEATLWLENGIDLVIDTSLASGSVRDLVLVFEPGNLANSVNWNALPVEDGRISLTDRDPELGALVVRRVTEAFGLYLDPTPGDQRVRVDERTDENRIGFVETR